MLQRFIVAGMAAVSLIATTGWVPAQTLDKIKKDGVLVVGVKADYKPFGFRNPSGAIIGFEPDLAREVANRLHVKVQLVPVVSSNRMQFLQEGKIELMIATMNVTPERQKIVGIVDPDYYASGVSVFAVKKAALKSWDQVKGQKICAIQGAWYNKEVAEKYGADIVAFKGTAESETALRQGNCIGFLYDDTYFVDHLNDPKWADFEMRLPSILVVPWGLAVKLEERNGPWGQFMSDTVKDWHKTGKLIELEAKWKIPPSPFLKKMHEQYK